MNYSNEQINMIINRCEDIVNNISKKHNYNENIKHLLYIIIPAFLLKYELRNEKQIIKVFNEIKIYINDTSNTKTPALFARKIYKRNNEYLIDKKIILKNYNNDDLISLLDNLIYEYNHAINSINNELIIENNIIKLRTGISYSIYDRELNYINTINKTLEEIINTKQTESIINIIKDLVNTNINNTEINNMLIVLNKEINKNYKSKSYYLQSEVCKTLLNNTTFINTIEKLRFIGEINDIEKWFDDITGQKENFTKLNKLLENTLNQEKELINIKFFKNRKINKIRNNIRDIIKIVELFNRNCNYK